MRTEQRLAKIAALRDCARRSAKQRKWKAQNAACAKLIPLILTQLRAEDRELNREVRAEKRHVQA